MTFRVGYIVGIHQCRVGLSPLRLLSPAPINLFRMKPAMPGSARKITVLLFAMLVATPFVRADDPPLPIKVFVLAGQSNMQGQGVVEMDHPEYYNGGKGNLVWSLENAISREQMQHLRNRDGSWMEREDVTIRYRVDDQVRRGNLTIGFTGYGGRSHIGPELQFGYVLGEALEEPVLLIKTAWGGKSLAVDFRPPSAPGETGPYYTRMISEIRAGLSDLGDRPWELAGFVWMQGWNDMLSEEATAEYADNLVFLAHDLRAEFATPQLPIVIGELGNGGVAKPDSGMARFRESQRQGAGRIENAMFVLTHDFARPPELSPNQGHGHHWYGNAESYFLIGDALGKAMLKLMDQPTGQSSSGDHP